MATAGVELRPERPADEGEVEILYDLVFGPHRFGLSSYRLREEVSPVGELGLVARDAGSGLVGALRFWPIRIGAAGMPALLAGPVGVHPTRQGEGVGAALIRSGLTRAAQTSMPKEAGETGCWTRVVLVGDEPYYRRFGFRRGLGQRLEFPPPTDPGRVLACELAEGAMAAVSGPVYSWAAGGAKEAP